MPRDIATKGKMPSLTVISMGKDKPAPGAGPAATPPDSDMGKESYFKCPECGAQLCAESKAEDNAEQHDAGEEMGIGG